MRRKTSSRWSEFEIEQLKRFAAEGLTAKQIAKAMNRDTRNVNARARMHGVELVRLWKRTEWTEEMIAYLTANYATVPGTEIANHLNISLSSIYNKAHQLGLEKDPTFAAETTRQRWKQGRHEGSRASHFSKGHEPMNKGIPMTEWMSEDAIKRSAKTRFKTRRPEESRNYKPIGSERVSKDGYVEVKVTDDHPVPARRWVGKHRLIWERAHGAIPKGHVVRFVDGNNRNFSLDNLELLTLAENGVRTAEMIRESYPEGYKQLIQMRGALTRQINKKVREMEQSGKK